MPEDSHASVGPLLLDHARQQHKVIILDQNYRARRVFDFLQHRVGELAIDLLIVLPVVGAKNGTRMCDMAERPKALIGEAVVIALLFFLAQPHSA